MDMNITNNYDISFGQKVPTMPLLKIGSGIFNYDEAKDFCNIFDKKFPGHVGFYKKARQIIKNIENKNPQIEEIFSDLSKYAKQKELSAEIDKLVKKLGAEIDVYI